MILRPKLMANGWMRCNFDFTFLECEQSLLFIRRHYKVISYAQRIAIQLLFNNLVWACKLGVLNDTLTEILVTKDQRSYKGNVLGVRYRAIHWAISQLQQHGLLYYVRGNPRAGMSIISPTIKFFKLINTNKYSNITQLRSLPNRYPTTSSNLITMLDIINRSNLTHTYTYLVPRLTEEASSIADNVLTTVTTKKWYRDPLILLNNLASIKMSRRIGQDYHKVNLRFSCGIQRMPKICRPTLKIDGECTVEYDYQATEPSIWYAMVGVVPPTNPYDMLHIPNTTREQRKRFMLLCMNCVSIDHAVDSIRGYLYSKFRESELDAKQVVNHVMCVHRAIEKYLCCGKALEFMYHESEIANEVMYQMALLDKPIIGIHDSFIVKQQDEVLIQTTMKQAFIKVLYAVAPSSYTGWCPKVVKK